MSQGGRFYPIFLSSSQNTIEELLFAKVITK